jgi:hypothetical protein
LAIPEAGLSRSLGHGDLLTLEVASPLRKVADFTLSACHIDNPKAYGYGTVAWFTGQTGRPLHAVTNADGIGRALRVDRRAKSTPSLRDQRTRGGRP